MGRKSVGPFKGASRKSIREGNQRYLHRRKGLVPMIDYSLSLSEAIEKAGL